MIRHSWGVLVVVALAMAGVALLCQGYAGQAWGELAPEKAKAIDALIRQLGAKEFDARETATKKLIEMGPNVLVAVEKTLGETDDPEVKDRCGKVEKEIEKKCGAKIWGPEGGALMETLVPSQVSINAENEPLTKVLAEIARQSGNHEMFLDYGVKDRPVTLRVKEVAYWEAVENLCALTGLCYRAEGVGCRLMNTRGYSGALAFAGPVVIRQAMEYSVAEHVDLPSKIYTDGTLMLEYTCEDRLEDVDNTTVTITKAVVLDGDGVERTLSNPGMGCRNGDGRKGGFIYLHLGPEALKYRRIGPIEGVVHLPLGRGAQTIRVEDAFDGAEHTGKFKDITLTAREGKSEGGKASIKVKQTVRGEEGAVPSYSISSRYHFEIVVAQYENGGWRGRIERSWPEVEGQGKLVSFHAAPGVGGKWTLVYCIPASTAEKDFPFRIEELKLPETKEKGK